MTHPIDASPIGQSATTPTAPSHSQSGADRFMRRLLRLPVDGPKATAAEAQKAFQTSILVAASSPASTSAR